MRNLREVLQENKEKYIRHLKELVEIDTHDLGHGIAGGLEKEGQDYLIALFEKMNASSILIDPMTEEAIQKCYQEHQEGNLNHNYDNRYNVYAGFSGKKSKKLMFNGHIDVMPADDVEKWSNPPFEPIISDGKIYGRGTADMKAGLMASIMAVQLLKDAGVEELPLDVVITSVCDEEGGGNGSMQAIMSGQKADGVVVCEGTSDELILAHMGFIFFKVTVKGRACHSGDKKKGVSAIEKAIKIIEALKDKEHQWLLEYKHPLLPPPNLNVGVIKGGDAGSTVAGECEFSTCVHYIPNQMSHNQVVEEFTDVVMRVARGDEWLLNHLPEIEIYQAGGGFEMEMEHPFVKAFAKAYQNAEGKDVKIVGSPAGCDSRLWRNIAKSPTIQFGPGHLAQCHGIDEWVSIEDYLESILVYANLILTFGED